MRHPLVGVRADRAQTEGRRVEQPLAAAEQQDAAARQGGRRASRRAAGGPPASGRSRRCGRARAASARAAAVGREIAPLPAHPRAHASETPSKHPRAPARGSPPAGRCPAAARDRGRPSARGRSRACTAPSRPSSRPTTRSTRPRPPAGAGAASCSSSANCSGSRNIARVRDRDRAAEARGRASRAQRARERPLVGDRLAPACRADLLATCSRPEAGQRQPARALELSQSRLRSDGMAHELKQRDGRERLGDEVIGPGGKRRRRGRGPARGR